MVFPDINDYDILAVYHGTRIPKVGAFINLLQTQVGFFWVILFPMILFFIYQAVRVVMNAMAYSKEKGIEQAKAAVENAELTEEQKQRAIAEYLAQQKAQASEHMKRILSAALAAVILLSLVLCGCAPAFDKTPAEYENVKWVTPDYSFRFNTADDCKGNFNYKDVKYNIQVKFDGSHVSVMDADKNKELFNGEWMYEDGDHLYIHTVMYNTADYEEFKTNYSEFYRLNQEKLK